MIEEMNNIPKEDDRKARKGKTHTYGVRVHDKNREANILALHEALLTKTFKTSPCDVFTIFEPKERLISRLSPRGSVGRNIVIANIY